MENNEAVIRTEYFEERSDMNVATTSSPEALEERFVSSATFDMLAIVTAAIVLTAIAGSGNAGQNVNMLIVLALPVALFALSLSEEKSRLTPRNLGRYSAALIIRSSTSEPKADTYSPSWPGGLAYTVACRGAMR
jgi:hypothetical protein